MLDGCAVPIELIGSTYTQEELISALYLENQILREQRRPTQFAEAVQPPSFSEIREESHFSAALRFHTLFPVKSGTKPRHLVIANTYPNYGAEYGNGFVHRRVKAYQSLGIEVDVLAMPRRTDSYSYEYDGVQVHVGNAYDLAALLQLRNYDSVSAHFLNPIQFETLRAARQYKKLPLTTFVHGYEASRWIRRVQTQPESHELRAAIERTVILQQFWSTVVEQAEEFDSFVFVSKYFHRAVEEDMDVVFPANSTHIIHNVVDEKVFKYHSKVADDRFRILWVRSAAARWYGADLATETLKRLLAGPYGPRITATIIGDGQHFDLFEKEFVNDGRVRVERRFASQEEIAELHKNHGFFLVPTRLDSQGVSRDEAMSSGLVPITNNVAAVPEFVDDDCAILAGHENVDEMVSKTEALMANPEAFLKMSQRAAARVRSQCGFLQTISREVSVIAPSFSEGVRS
ncbi:glycosyltransferase family 4 protein [Corynebacterium aquilae]|uniref:glycosyltransferase family 4 protein n=1 Tax=Corynebacterium aquilae TaxID=203263 RepID=UPI000951CE6C|nr:glycosyltransferase family 4 protein [Corynebacterium aquilae]